MDRTPGRVAKGKDRKIVVGMSGGVDSTASLILLKKNGWDPIGVSLKFSVWSENKSIKENPQSSENSIKKAKKICEKYGCEHQVIDVREDFEKGVIEYFVESLEKNRTPNPCMVCNKNTKFKHLIKFADSKNIEYIATGHYARIVKSRKYGSHFLALPKDKNKDQTYYLSLLPQEWLKRIIFPLGELTKNEAYKIVEKEGLKSYKKEAQSQDFCFIAEKSLDEFIEKEIETKPGKIFNTQGKVIGEHRGLQHYTIGQRKGIGLAGGPYYVVKKDIAENQLVVSKDKKDLGETEIKLTNVFFPNKDFYGKKLKVKAKIRYQQKSTSAELIPVNESGKKCKLIFKRPKMGVTPGQYAVFYIGNLCVGSGVIE
jgi:tRNA-specific 2-thiouridylase